MTTRFFCMWKGRRLFRVLAGGEELFCGSGEECKRYLELHHLKEMKAAAAAQRTPRRRRPTVRIYRLASRASRRAAV